MSKSEKVKMSSSRSRKIASSDKRFGAVAVEFAMCLPLLMLLLLGCVEIAGANMIKHATESAAYEGARIGILPGATQAGVQRSVDQILSSVGAEGATVQVNPQVIVQDGEDVEVIEVVVSVPYARNAWIAPFVIRNDPTFRSSCALRREVL
jgi:Flp pilus assembly protein TadG